ncbi:glucose 1-dehydrogenase [Thalassobius vesicularis]|uniref:Glucose 1-dehydrogenase n=1 Tax=Thalassobius vesicularis TaxID=1294297 RepID=A0A4S3M6Y4_9RHOB|nr:SDR family oxidoreductase [Thalassobius vesicularis]THD72929.1 glucose 1-dehydrogenase [Thalassobius vesicularis]
MRLFDLTGKVALITGGSRGLGLQIAEGLAEAGAAVILTARKQAELDDAQAHLQKITPRVATIACDLSDLDSIPGVVDQANAIFGPIDILVNNAGTSWASPTEDHPLDGWNKVMTLNLTAPFVLTQAVAKASFLPRKTGNILNVASIGGLSGNRADSDMFTIAYNSSKAAMINFTRALATEWGRHGINVNALAPGFFPSKMSEKLIDRLEQTLLPSIPLHRFGGDEDLKGAAIFLVSPAARHVTGQCLAVDGGATA